MDYETDDDARLILEHAFGAYEEKCTAAAEAEEEEEEDECLEVSRGNVFLRISRDHRLGGIVIAFRGTDSCRDWVHNLSRRQTPFVGTTSVHSGFVKHVAVVYADILQYIRRTRHNNDHGSIYVVGHSLGGAAAVVCGARLVCDFPGTRVRVVTAGAPRVGDSAFRNWYIRQRCLSIVRYENPRDPVPKVPYWGYYHVGERRVVYCDDTAWYRPRTAHSVETYTRSMF